MGNEDEENSPTMPTTSWYDNLPSEDKAFIDERRLVKNQTLLERVRYFEPELDVADIVRTHARIGQFIDIDALNALDFDHAYQTLPRHNYPKSSYDKKSYQLRQLSIVNIREHGNNAIAHLCFPHIILDKLTRKDSGYVYVPTISELADILQRTSEGKPIQLALIAPSFHWEQFYEQLVTEQYNAWKSLGNLPER